MLKQSILPCLILVASSCAAKVYVNQAGYDLGLSKVAVVEGAATMAGTSFTLKSGATVVFTGTLGASQSVTGWGTASYYTADFTSFVTPGTYRLHVTDGTVRDSSPPFSLGTKVLSATLAKGLDYFKNDRANDADVWNADASIPFVGGRTDRRDVRGGWYDAAGDISKYLSHLSYANFMNPQQTPMTVWGLAFLKDRIPNLVASVGKADQLQQEALWGADFLIRMLDPAGYFYITVFDGWSGSVGNRYITAFEGMGGTMTSKYQAAFREGGGMSIAALARVASWGVNGDSSSAAYLSAAKRAYAHLKSKQPLGGVCSYCDDSTENIIDDYTALMAASELYATTQDTAYRADARLRAASLAGRITLDGYFNSNKAGTRPYWHAADAGLPLVALTRYLEVDPAADPSIAAAMRTHLGYLVGVTNKVANPFGYARQTFKTGGAIKEGFFIPHDNESGYWWQGENARLGSLAAAAFYAGRKVLPDPAGPRGIPDSLARYAVAQLDWVLGRNPFSICFLQGVGVTNPPAYFASKPQAGHLQGGIVNGITGSNTDGSGLSWQPNASDSWRWTEQWICHITWYLIALAAMEDEASTVPVSTKKPSLGSISGQGSLDFSTQIAGGQLSIGLPHSSARPVAVRVFSPQGRLLASAELAVGATSVSLTIPGGFRGLALVQVGATTRAVLP